MTGRFPPAARCVAVTVAVAVAFATVAALVPADGAAGEDGPAPPASPLAPPLDDRDAGGAANLALARGISFIDDTSPAFPIVGTGLDAGEIADDRPTAIFFGASHCWNTNREAERFVAVYRKHRGAVRFLVVDVERPSPGQAALLRRFYSGLIPTLAVLDRSGRPVYAQAGETATSRGDTDALDAIVRRALASP